jgi:hypothetical protein
VGVAYSKTLVDKKGALKITRKTVTKNYKRYFDVIPLVILIASAVILCFKYFNGDILFFKRHVVALLILPINIGLFFWRHQIAVLVLGLTLILGLFGVISFSPAISMTTIKIGNGNGLITIFYGQAIFVLWLAIHFIVSGRYYVGILTKNYWQQLFKPA